MRWFSLHFFISVAWIRIVIKHNKQKDSKHVNFLPAYIIMQYNGRVDTGKKSVHYVVFHFVFFYVLMSNNNIIDKLAVQI